ncbi:hypothetical protein [Streptomyces fuscichromogenes]|uniref:Uncharacterized protein n=1 Tax=Streptomyces fuscichromogenes TaxID=1324013 RepID=A0A917XR66_9ACTN|nr:hypothetical protein [Streptomyces fuscichromogenes]GGN47730.1 hypothetical protein GCM10011578_101500 [Streptomyces fuscichromogenes]
MKTTPPRNGPDDTPRAEHERDAAWSHLSSADEEDYGLDPEYWPGGKVVEVAERLDEVIERAYVSDLKNLSPTDLLATLLVLRKLREDFTTAEGLLIETARKKNVGVGGDTRKTRHFVTLGNLSSCRALRCGA